MEDKHCFIIGLPNAGKSTFLAALWYSLFHCKNNKMKYSKLEGNLNYLKTLSNTWANVQVLNRTLPGEEKENLAITLERGDSQLRLNLPDRSGETFQSHYTNRKISKDLMAYIYKADAIMLFINVADVKDITYHSDMDSDILGEVEDETESKDENETNRTSEDEGDGTKHQAFLRDEKNDPMQVQIVDLLQFIETIRDEKSVKLGVILSAWDQLMGSEYESTPELFVKKKMSLLWQFLQSNHQLFKCEYWGISAQGGTLEPENVEKLQNYLDPTERIFVLANDGQKSKDITEPIDSLLGD